MLFISLFYFPALKKQITNQRGQGLIEYLIIVALVGIASMSIMRVVGQNVKARFGNVSAALGASTKSASLDAADASTFKKNDLTNFFDGAKSNSKAKGSSSSDGNGGGW